MASMDANSPYAAAPEHARKLVVQATSLAERVSCVITPMLDNLAVRMAVCSTRFPVFSFQHKSKA